MEGIPEGLCQCGCGEATNIVKAGPLKGRPARYRVGHAMRGRRVLTGPDWKDEDRGYVTPCRIWQHGKTTAGYGWVTVLRPGQRSTQDYAHRIEWEKVHGPIPKGMHTDHLCRQHDCGRVDHLQVVTPKVNFNRGVGGHLAGARSASKTHCPSGHPYSGANLYLDPQGKRQCRTCRAIRGKESKERAAARKRAA